MSSRVVRRALRIWPDNVIGPLPAGMGAPRSVNGVERPATEHLAEHVGGALPWGGQRWARGRGVRRRRLQGRHGWTWGSPCGGGGKNRPPLLTEGALASARSATRRPVLGPWLCVSASRRICPYRRSAP